MPWWVSIIIGAAACFEFDFFKAILKRFNLKPSVQNLCAFVLTMVLTVIIAFAIKFAGAF